MTKMFVEASAVCNEVLNAINNIVELYDGHSVDLKFSFDEMLDFFKIQSWGIYEHLCSATSVHGKFDKLGALMEIEVGSR